jgi:hypothetical protein
LIGRWPGLYSALNLAILIAANALPFSVAVHDKVSDGRVHPISLWVPVLRIVETFGLIAVAGSCKSGWQRSPAGGPSALRCSKYPGSRFDSERRRAREPTLWAFQYRSRWLWNATTRVSLLRSRRRQLPVD